MKNFEKTTNIKSGISIALLSTVACAQLVIAPSALALPGHSSVGVPHFTSSQVAHTGVNNVTRPMFSQGLASLEHQAGPSMTKFQNIALIGRETQAKQIIVKEPEANDAAKLDRNNFIAIKPDEAIAAPAPNRPVYSGKPIVDIYANGKLIGYFPDPSDMTTMMATSNLSLTAAQDTLKAINNYSSNSQFVSAQLPVLNDDKANAYAAYQNACLYGTPAQQAECWSNFTTITNIVNSVQ